MPIELGRVTGEDDVGPVCPHCGFMHVYYIAIENVYVRGKRRREAVFSGRSVCAACGGDFLLRPRGWKSGEEATA